MPLQKLQFRPGLNREGTDYSNEGGYTDGDKIRFRSGFPEKIGGWTQLSPSQFNGVCRSIWVWLDGDLGAGNVYIGVGTNTKYYIYFGGAYNDITPITQTNTLSNPFTTVSGSKIVTVTDSTYGPNVGDFIIFSGASAVGGLTINGEYSVTTVLSPTQYTITAASSASSSATGGGTVTTQYELPIGLNVYTAGTGWGAGVWGGVYNSPRALGANPFATTSGSAVVTVTQTAHGLSTNNWVVFSGATAVGGISAPILNTSYQVTVTGANTYTINVATISPTLTASATTTGGGSVAFALIQVGSQGWGTSTTVGIGQQLRLWTNDNFGADLVIAPRGGAIYYWQDSLGAGTRSQPLASLANATTILTDTATFGSGVSTITVTTTNAPYIYPYMHVTGAGIPAGTYVLPTYLTGLTSVPISANTTSVSSGSYAFSYAGAFVPTSTYQVTASSIQEFIVAFGANPYSPNNAATAFNPLLVRWSDQANPYQWIPQITNQSGEYPLTYGSYISCARTTRQETLVWTDTCLYSMQYLGAPYVWGFQVLMNNITIMSPNAAITVNNVTYWMGRDRFYMYSGTVQVLPCALRQYLFVDINYDQSYQVFSGSNEGFNEVWWFYVSNDTLNGTSVDKYIVYNYLDQVWYYGTMARTAWLETGSIQYPIAADYNGRLLYHENGNDDVSTSSPQPITAYVQSSDFDIGDGHNFGFVWRMLPDVNFNGSTINQPAVTFQVQARQNSGSAYFPADAPAVQSSQNYQNIAEYTIQQFTGQVYTRLRGRQMAFKIYSTGLGVAWQLGSPRLDVRPDGRR
jgi:hypothetical protein